MKLRQVFVTALVLTLILTGTRPLLAAGPENATPAEEAITLNIRWGEPVTLDPALAADTSSTSIINQLFAGLVRLDDSTGAAIPDLAESWIASADSSVYTFTLRSGLVWSDAHPLTAGDVRYGILRSLAPTTQAPYAYILEVIKNASGYNSGSITDPNQVGITVLDDTHVRFTLEGSAGYFPSILGNWVARPMPEWAITQWGSAWTEAAHIVTSGPYRLTSWTHNRSFTLAKNDTFYSQAQTQIATVNAWILGTDWAAEVTAWRMYLQGQLDTISPASPYLAQIRSDPYLSQELHIAPQPCTYYYGFSLSKPPFDQLLVRQAFIAAADRQGLIDTVLGGVQQPALTFTPPGIFGHVDGAAEGVGIPYSPAQARQWLADAGYPNGQGLPAIELWFNTDAGHQAVAQYIRQNWITNLNVTVTLRDMAWNDYQAAVKQGQFAVWRLGWCPDYNDAFNFLHDGIHGEDGAWGNWNNPTYWATLEQARGTTDPDARKALYKQAETILVQSDAVMLPLYYYYGSAVLTKPYLQRTVDTGGLGYVAGWRISRMSSTNVDPGSATNFTATGDSVQFYFPAGAVSVPAVVSHTVLSPAMLPPTGALSTIGHNFELTALNRGTGQPVSLAPGATYTLVANYSAPQYLSRLGNSLALYYWDGGKWVREPTSTLNTANHIVQAQPNHFSIWAVLDETRYTYLPLTLRNR